MSTARMFLSGKEDVGIFEINFEKLVVRILTLQRF